MDRAIFEPALALGRLLRERKLGSRELLGLCWAQVEKHNPRINAVIYADIERARKSADAADRRLKEGAPLSPLDGVPMTAKESFDWTGTPSTWGTPRFKDNIPQSDAVALRRLLEAGAVMFGKTNVPLMLADWQSFNEVYGTTNNPWDISRTPGGSSGGSAAALASGMSAIEIGTDIGASIRNPAHYCGVYGHKPTFGIVPMRGHSPPGVVTSSDISVAGPLARSARDLVAMLHLLAGPDIIEGRGYRLSLLPDERDFGELRVAVMSNDPVSEVDRPVEDLILSLSEWLGPRVRRLSTSARPDFSMREAMDLYITLLRAATSRRQSDEEFAANAERVRAFAPDDHGYLSTMMRAYVMPHRAWLFANERRHQIRLLWDAFFEEWDVLLCPAAASAAFPHDQVGDRHERTIEVNGKRVPTTDQLFWAGLSGGFYLPSTVAPIGLTPGGLPVGVQIIARQFGDRTSLRFAELLERDYYAFVPPPGF
jgi:amidase